MEPRGDWCGVMSFESGQKLGGFTIVNLLGKGGMGEVYLARDEKLGRDVAVKVLPESFAVRPEWLIRFEREAQILASLNHSNVATVYGFEHDDVQGVHYLIMEHIDGETLGERMEAGPLSISDALPIFIDIARGLDAAHEAGIVHRDLKPDNVKINSDGVVKILDFGIAKSTGVVEPQMHDPNAPTTPMSPVAVTAEGTLMGTPVYMSPEQARGKGVDKRTDLWAYGCCFFEALTGNRPFEEETIADTVGAILEREPDWDRLPGSTPYAVRNLLKRCLEKNSRRRLSSAGDVAIALEDVFDNPLQDAQSGAVVALPQQKDVPVWSMGVVILVSVTIIGALMMGALGGSPNPEGVVAHRPGAFVAEQSHSIVRFPVNSPVEVVGGPLFSPDGSQIIFVGEENGSRRLYLRRLNEDDSKIGALEGTEGAMNPFFSPDGEWLAFFRGSDLLKYRMSNGVVEVITNGVLEFSRGTWNADGTIILGNRLSGLWRVGAVTGSSEIFLQPDWSQDVYGNISPSFLPDGKHLVFTGVRGMWDDSTTITSLYSLDDLTTRALFTGGTGVRYVSTGHLMYQLGSNLWAVPFDGESLSLNGKATSIVGDVTLHSSFSLSRTGHLTYLSGESLSLDRNTDFVWVDREGAHEEFTKTKEQYAFPSVSPDGRRVVMTVGPRGGNRNWIVDVARSTSFPLMAENPNNALPVWSPQGDWIAFIGENEDLYRIRPTPNAKPELVLSGVGAHIPTSWSPDGSEIVYTQGPLDDVHKIKAVNVDTLDARILVETKGADVHGRVSPKGNLLAYTTNFSGTREVWVQPYPDTDAGRSIPISSIPSRDPVWSHDGSELFMLQDDNKALWSVSVPGDDKADWGIPEKLFDFDFEIQDSGPEVSCYDVAPDGRFIFAKATEKVGEASANRREIKVVLNVFEEIKRLVPHSEER